jgi:hypothetical protein
MIFISIPGSIAQASETIVAVVIAIVVPVYAKQFPALAFNEAIRGVGRRRQIARGRLQKAGALRLSLENDFVALFAPAFETKLRGRVTLLVLICLGARGVRIVWPGRGLVLALTLALALPIRP